MNVFGVEIPGASNKLAESLGITFNGITSWLWQFSNRHGIRNKVAQGESASCNKGTV